jgi:hypothetical protein
MRRRSNLSLPTDSVKAMVLVTSRLSRTAIYTVAYSLYSLTIHTHFPSSTLCNNNAETSRDMA